MSISLYSMCQCLRNTKRVFSQDRRMDSIFMGNHVLARLKTTLKVPYPPLNPPSTAAFQKDFGKIYDKKPFKFQCIKGKSYLWCACGWSKSQPFCDNTHKNPLMRISMRPVRFVAPETMEYWFCNCKQSAHRPFCDGTHRRIDIQEAIRS